MIEELLLMQLVSKQTVLVNLSWRQTKRPAVDVIVSMHCDVNDDFDASEVEDGEATSEADEQTNCCLWQEKCDAQTIAKQTNDLRLKLTKVTENWQVSAK